MSASSIEWTEATWNPVAGCTILSPGCTHCYAMRMAARLEAMGMAKYQGTTRKSGGRAVWTGRVNLDRQALRAPLSWTRPRRIFVNSMSDLFHDAVPTSFIAQMWEVMAKAHWHSFQILTKRPERMAALVGSLATPPLPNVWLGTSVESAAWLSRLDHLREVPAAVRFVSFEPLLGPLGSPDLKGIHWAIVGGESGPAARPMAKEWVEQIERACRRHGTAFFFKQWGGPNKKKAGRLLNGRTWDEYPSSTGPIAAAI
jgi:protein gp37